jgi:cell division protein FtsQ
MAAKKNKSDANHERHNKVGENTSTSWRFGLGLLFFIAVLFSLISVSWWVGQRIVGQESTPVTSIDVVGEINYSHRGDIITAIETVDLGNFFQLNVDDVQKQVLALPWVYSVAVRKQWPNQLKIYVVDQSPVALWNGDFLLNKFGKAFQADISRINHALPKFFGPEGTEQLALKNYRNINELLDFEGLGIDELILTERFSWQLTLNDGITLNLGREERVERIVRFIEVYPMIKAQLALRNKTKIKREKEKNQAVDYIDLRYDTGLAVGWKTAVKKTAGKVMNKTISVVNNKKKIGLNV